MTQESLQRRNNQSINEFKDSINRVSDKFSKKGWSTMTQEVNQNAILQAILELSKQVQGMKTEIQQQLETVENKLEGKLESVEKRLEVKIEAVEKRLEEKIESVEKRLEEKIESVEKHLGAKIDGVDAKVRVLSHELLETKADVLMLKQVK